MRRTTLLLLFVCGATFFAGLDLAAPEGTPIRATANGIVHFAGHIPARQDAPASLYGNFVVLDHGNGLKTRYAHLSQAAVAQGESVTAGSRVGGVGATGCATGPHLHFEVSVRGANVDPALSL